MAKQTINIGSSPNDRKGDSLRAAFLKVNANFSELYSGIESIEIGEVSWESVTGKPTFSAVAVTGDYNDLTNKPTKITDISQLTDNQGLLADSFDGGSSSSVFDEDLTINGGSASTIYNESLTINVGGA